MSNTRKVPGDPGTGLVELSAEPGLVLMHLFPPGRTPVELRLSPQDAFDLAQGMIDASYEAAGEPEAEGEADARAQRP